MFSDVFVKFYENLKSLVYFTNNNARACKNTLGVQGESISLHFWNNKKKSSVLPFQPLKQI